MRIEMLEGNGAIKKPSDLLIQDLANIPINGITTGTYRIEKNNYLKSRIENLTRIMHEYETFNMLDSLEFRILETRIRDEFIKTNGDVLLKAILPSEPKPISISGTEDQFFRTKYEGLYIRRRTLPAKHKDIASYSLVGEKLIPTQSVPPAA